MKLANQLLATAVSLACLSALAADAVRSPGIESKGYVWNRIDKEKTLTLSKKGDAAHGKTAYTVCQGCHREDGAGKPDADYPQLAGQHVSVLVKQMVDVRAGRRDNPKMHPFVSADVLGPQELADVAAYLNSLPVPVTNGKGDGLTLARGQSLYDKDCAQCHGDSGEGDAAKFYPMVASQHYDYLVHTLTQIRDGKRRNANPKMVKVARKYSDADLRSLSDYMSRLAPAGVGAAAVPAK